MDANLMFKLHITKKCQNAMLNIFKIKSIRHLLTINTTTCLVLSLCLSHLDYCNSMFYGLPAVTIAKMQRIQNMCARLVLRKGKYDSITQTMYALHWLPILYHTDFKILTLTHKLLNGKGPLYLRELLTWREPLRSSLRSGKDQYLLVIPNTKRKTFAARSFSVAAPTLWNQLPLDTRRIDDLLTFKKAVKTQLFMKAYQDVSFT